MNTYKCLRALIIFIIVAGWIFSGWPQIWQEPPIPPEIQEAQAAVAFQAVSTIADSTGADVTVTLPLHEANDIFLLQVVVRDTDDTLTVTGWTQIATIDDGTAARHWWYWKRAASSSETNPLVDKSTATGDTYASVISYRGAETSGDPWEAKGTAVCTGTSDPFNLNGITTLTDNALVVATWNDIDNFLASAVYSATNPSSLTSNMLNQSAVGDDGTNAAGSAVRTTAGTTGNVSVDPNKAPDGACGVVLGLKPLTITISILRTVGDQFVTYGTVRFGDSTSTDPTGINDPKTYQNNGTVAEKFSVATSATSGGTAWTLSNSTSTQDNYVHRFATTSDLIWQMLDVVDQAEIASSSVAVSGTVTFYFSIALPATTAESPPTEKTITLTVQAEAAP